MNEYVMRSMTRNDVDSVIEWAGRLLAKLLACVPDGAVFYPDVPGVNEPAVDPAHRCDMSVVFETARRYTGEVTRLPLEKIFGVTTFELG